MFMNRIEELQHDSIKELLNIKTQEYNKKLLEYSFEDITNVFDILSQKRKSVKTFLENINVNNEEIDEKTKEIFDLLKQYAQEIKQIFIENRKFIIHISEMSPNEMIDRKIKKSINRPNHYETECGDWVFASSDSIYTGNPYLARNSKDGMILIDKNTYMYGGDNMEIKRDEQGHNIVVLKKPKYVYIINPTNFMPVVSLIHDESGEAVFDFSEEWISEVDVEIDDNSQVIDMCEITDVTEVVKNNQVLCDVYKTGQAGEIRNSPSREEAIKKLLLKIKMKKIRYINGEAGINVSPIFEKNKMQQHDDGR